MRQKSVFIDFIGSLLILPFATSIWPLTGNGNLIGGVDGVHGSRMNFITSRSSRSTFASIRSFGLFKSGIDIAKSSGEPSNVDEGIVTCSAFPFRVMDAP